VNSRLRLRHAACLHHFRHHDETPVTSHRSPVTKSFPFILLRTLLHFFAFPENSTPFFSIASALFVKNTRGWGYLPSIHEGKNEATSCQFRSFNRPLCPPQSGRPPMPSRSFRRALRPLPATLRSGVRKDTGRFRSHLRKYLGSLTPGARSQEETVMTRCEGCLYRRLHAVFAARRKEWEGNC
jgi:hypothetical protein